MENGGTNVPPLYKDGLAETWVSNVLLLPYKFTHVYTFNQSTYLYRGDEYVRRKVMEIFIIPFVIGLLLGFFFKGMISRYEKRKALDRHLDGLFREVNDETNS